MILSLTSIRLVASIVQCNARYSYGVLIKRGYERFKRTNLFFYLWGLISNGLTFKSGTDTYTWCWSQFDSTPFLSFHGI
ncbi:hypothetical protein BJ165DRAFT_1475074 [Panaeolus papilionaceus]|nr:hypothetical protein BJ165DRAFT_1475074 [Panaeolus papilionaceus]